MKLIKRCNRLKVARINTGLTQREVSKITKFITCQALSHYENDRSVPSNKVYITLSKLYNTSLDYLFYLDEYKNHDDYLSQYLGLTEQSIKLLKKHKLNQVDSNQLKEHIKQIIESEDF